MTSSTQEVSSIKSPFASEDYQQSTMYSQHAERQSLNYNQKQQYISKKYQTLDSFKFKQSLNQNMDKESSILQSVPLSPISQQQQATIDRNIILSTRPLQQFAQSPLKIQQQNDEEIKISPRLQIREAIKEQVMMNINIETQRFLMLKSAHLSTLSICRFMQFLSILGNYLFYVFWLLYTKSTLSTYYNIKLLDSNNIPEVCLVSLVFVLISISVLCQLTFNISIIIELKKSQSINLRKISFLKISLIIFELLAFILLLVYNQQFSSDFTIAGFFTFAQSIIIQYYYLRQYSDFRQKQKQIDQQKINPNQQIQF